MLREKSFFINSCLNYPSIPVKLNQLIHSFQFSSVKIHLPTHLLHSWHTPVRNFLPWSYSKDVERIGSLIASTSNCRDIVSRRRLSVVKSIISEEEIRRLREERVKICVCASVRMKTEQNDWIETAHKIFVRRFSFKTKAVGFRPLTGEFQLIVPRFFWKILLRVPLLFSD